MKKSEELAIIEYVEELLAQTHQDDVVYNTFIKKVEEKIFFLVQFETIESTHTFANLWDISRIPKGVVVALQAFQQTKGRGQKNNTFQSPSGNMYITFLFRSKLDFNITLVPYTTSLAIIDSLNQFLLEEDPQNISSNEPDFKIKWINDVYHKNKKISGILIDSSSSNDSIKMVVSMGININLAPQLKDITTSCLRDFTRSTIELNMFLNILLVNINYRFNMLLEEKSDSEIINDTEEILLYKNQEVVIYNANTLDQLHEGVFKGLDRNGVCILINKDNKEVKVVDGRMRKKHVVSYSTSYNVCSCLSALTDKRSKKFYYFMFFMAFTLFNRMYYYKLRHY